jgi:two-component system sensor histidine kinase AtoS
VVSVHNTGSYIPPQVRRQLFVPFFTTKPTGTGLGLAIARQIVTSMDGRIDVQSDPDAGTTFTVEIPLAVQEQPAAALAG